MTNATVYESTLEGLLTCGRCHQPLIAERTPDGELTYRCSPHGNPFDHWCTMSPVDARCLDHAVIESILQTILTEKNQSRLISRLDQYTARAAGMFPVLGHPEDITRQEIRELTETPELFIQAVQGPGTARQFFGTFIKNILVHEHQAEVCFAIKLPEDSHYPGQTSQIVEIPRVTQ